ncbi:hypothetical protein [Methylobacterium radiotolerans]|uniref:hypothetical protein n=1 Tax=Methylobacterium radiotolerans TaxID=31998 RepID=UPI000D5EFCDC|nr:MULTISPECIES: hypothetical protein [Methylobacterium]MDE3748615.1 hypothetical protein [Methylobacterium radiotolerans]PVZ05022.1 hypothetical protein C7388_10514 [Methylobacterium organophilum]
MTSINISLDAAAGYIVSDGLGYDAHRGGATCCITKVIALPHLRAAVATRGSALLPQMMFGGLNALPSFEACIAALPVLFADLMSRLATVDVPLGPEHGSSEVFLVGRRENSTRPECWYVHAGGQAGEPFQAVSIDGITSDVTGGSERLQALAASARDPFDPVPIYWPERDGPELLEGIRGFAGASVGGFCQLTTVARDEIGMRILRRWPEHVTLPFNTTPVP